MSFHYRICVLFCLVLIASRSVHGASLTDATSLRTALMTSYDKYTRPVLNQSHPVQLDVYLYLMSISGLDEVEGVLTSVIAFSVAWSAVNLQWTPSSYGNLGRIPINENLIWRPYFMVANGAKKANTIGMPNLQAQLSSDGSVSMLIADLIESTCDVDVTYFPFDEQTCVIQFMAFSYSTDQINLTAHNAFLEHYSENNVWILKSTKSETDVFGTMPFVKISITLDRRYTFYILNLYSPVIILSFLNAMVFILPADSGERTGYAITCLLSLSVYMTFASESLPTSSKPIPVLIYVLLIYVIISSLMCVQTIIGLKFHMTDSSTEPPKCLARLCCHRAKRNAVADETTEMKHSEDEDNFTWKTFAVRFDRFCFVMNIFAICALSFLYLLVVTIR